MGQRIDEPWVVLENDGDVTVSGPDGWKATFTAEAAAKTASLMIEQAAYARGAKDIAAAAARRSLSRQ